MTENQTQFLYVKDDQGEERFISLYQIASVLVGKNRVELTLTNGHVFNIIGEGSRQLIVLLARHSITGDGTFLPEAVLKAQEALAAVKARHSSQGRAS